MYPSHERATRRPARCWGSSTTVHEPIDEGPMCVLVNGGSNNMQGNAVNRKEQAGGGGGGATVGLLLLGAPVVGLRSY